MSLTAIALCLAHLQLASSLQDAQFAAVATGQGSSAPDIFYSVPYSKQLRNATRALRHADPKLRDASEELRSATKSLRNAGLPVLAQATRNPQGAPWTKEEMHAVRETLWNIYEGKRKDFESLSCEILGDEEYPCMLERMEPNVFEKCDSPNATIAARLVSLTCKEPNKVKKMTLGAIPSQAKFLRLGFHDCFKYADKSGGCDGCLNFENLFVVKNMEELSNDGKKRTKHAGFPYDFNSSANTNLAATADILERIYNDKDFGYQKHYLTKSLRESGKSRADLWAFATLAAVDWFQQRNNRVCSKKGSYHLYKEPLLNLSHECTITPTRTIEFQSGRRDCADWSKPLPGSRWREYETSLVEVSPDPHSTGKEVVEFMNAQFGLTPRETVAALGAHSVGTMTSTNSGFRYTWMGRELGQDMMLNNLYYRVMTFRPIYLEQDLAKLSRARKWNMPLYGPSAPFFTMRPRALSPGYGPVQWHMHTQSEDGSNLHNGTTHVAMLNADMGLYLNFERTPGGYPLRPSADDCQVLRDSPSGQHIRITKTDVEDGCLQSEDFGGDTPLYKIVEEFADNQDTWWNEFTLVMEKLLSNGYSEGELVKHGPIRALHDSPNSSKRHSRFITEVRYH